jgi:phosphonopyruvate decarboxylase
MIDTAAFGAALKESGFNFYSGVPCSYLKYLINYALNDCDYIMAANEGDAAALCAGAYMGGRRPVILCQNSGLTNAVSPLTSLNYIFKIPLLGFVSLRGGAGYKDEPQHELMGEITGGLLDLMKIKHETLSKRPNEYKLQIKRAARYIDNNESYFFIVEKETFSEIKLKTAGCHNKFIKTGYIKTIENLSDTGKIDAGRVPGAEAKPAGATTPERIEALKIIDSFADDKTALIAATGKTGRELHDLNDRANNFYMVGSMGCASSIAAGLALCKPDKNIIAIDGDGALLMRMGAMATAGYYSPANMLHILLDNRSHASTGGQFTVSAGVDFIAIARACGYTSSFAASGNDSLKTLINDWKKDPRLTFIHLIINKNETSEPGRPGLTPPEVRRRFVNFLAK